MITTSDKELKTVSLEKDTWILEAPVEVCEHEGFPKGALISLTLKNAEFESFLYAFSQFSPIGCGTHLFCQ